MFLEQYKEILDESIVTGAIGAARAARTAWPAARAAIGNRAGMIGNAVRGVNPTMARVGAASGVAGVTAGRHILPSSPPQGSITSNAVNLGNQIKNKAGAVLGSMSTGQKIGAGLGGAVALGGAAYLANKLRNRNKSYNENYIRGLEEAASGAIAGGITGLAAHGIGTYFTNQEKRAEIEKLKNKLDKCKSLSCKEDIKSQLSALHKSIMNSKDDSVGPLISAGLGAGVGHIAQNRFNKAINPSIKDRFESESNKLKDLINKRLNDMPWPYNNKLTP